MYGFRDTGATSVTARVLPTEAMEFDGQYLENEIVGYTTIAVSGRELVGRKIVSQDIDGRDGQMYLASNLQFREITITYKLSASTAVDFRDKYSKLNAMLQKEQVKIRFADELNYYFIGTLQSTRAVPQGINEVISSFTIFCNDPYKRQNPRTLTGIGNVTINTPITFPVFATEISMTLAAATSQVVLRNITQNKTITFENSFVAGNALAIIFGETVDIKVNGMSRPAIMHWESDYETFLLHTNDVIRVTPSTTEMTIRVGDKML